MIHAKLTFRSEIKRAIRRIDRKETRVLFKLGAYIRKAMQRSMRYAGKRGGKSYRSKPGEPPRAHRDGRGPLLRKLIAFAVDKRTKRVATGPQIDSRSRSLAPKPLPALLERGGTTTVFQDRKKTKPVQAFIKPRPFAAPLLTDGGKELLRLLTQERL